MPSLDDIVKIDISVEDGALNIQSFNSLLLMGKTASFVASQPSSFAAGEVRRYTKLADVQADAGIKSGGEIEAMAATAFAQQPAVSEVYITWAADAVEEAAITSTDLDAILANNNDWFGYAGEFNDPVSIAAMSSKFGKTKYGFHLIEAAPDSIPSGLNGLSDYTSLWHTKETDSTKKYVNVAAASRLLALVPGSYTGAFKTLQGVSTSSYSPAEEDLLRPSGDSPAHRINQYSSTAGRAITWEGLTASTASKGYIDTYIGLVYLETRMTEDVFATLASTQKLAYTRTGAQMISGVLQTRLQQSVNEGFLAADPAPEVRAPDMNDATLRALRETPPFEFTATTAGAIHVVNIDGKISL